MDSSLEQTLAKLLIPDNSVIIQATSEIKEALKDPHVCTSLLNIACGSQNLHVRQYAIVLIRRKFSSKKNWQMFPDAFRENVKHMVIQRLVIENEPLVRSALADLGGTIARYELSNGTWPQLLAFIMDNLKSADPQAREFGSMMLSVIVNSTSFHMHSQIPSLLNMLPHILKETENKMVLSYSIRTLTSLIPQLHKKDVNLLQNLLPQIFFVIKEIVRGDDDSGYKLMEFFDELIEAELPIVVPYVKPIMELFFEFISSSEYQLGVKIKALYLIGLLIENKSKTIVKQKLIEPILKIIFPIMCTTTENSTSEEMEPADPDEIDNEDISKVASQVLDMMALNLPPGKLIAPLLTLLEPALQSQNPYHRKAAYMAIGVIVEGCSVFIQNKYLSQMMQCIFKGISDSSPVVKKAAFFALGQFAEHIKSDISKYSADFLPPFVDYLVSSCHNLQDNYHHITEVQRIFHQFETFCESAEPVLTPYLPCIMEKIFALYTLGHTIRTKILTLNALASIASAAKKDITPYLQRIVAIIKSHLTGNQDEESRTLEIQAIDTLSTLVTVMEPNSLTELCRDCMIYSTSMLNLTSDPDLKRRIYNLFGSLAAILKENIGQYLSLIIPHIIRSLKLSYLEEEKNPNLTTDLLPVFDLEDSSASENDMDDDSLSDDYGWYTVKNSYLEEKVDACKAIQDIAYNAPQSFFPYFHDCAEDVMEMMNAGEDDVRIVAITTNTQLCFLLDHNFERLKEKEDLHNFLGQTIPELINIADHDKDRNIVIAALESLENLLKKFKKVLNGKLSSEPIMTMIFKILTGEARCLKNCDENITHDQAQTEYDILLIEYAAGLMPSLANILPHEQYNQYFVTYMTIMFPKLQHDRTEAERSFTAGTLAECCESMEENVKPFAPQLFQTFLNSVHDEDEEVRSNSVYGLGVLLENGKETLFDQYVNVLNILSTILASETDNKVRDNICATVARMILTNISCIPIEQVFPVLIQNMPLKEDIVENATILRCISFMLNNLQPEVYSQLENIFHICSKIMSQEKFSDDAVQKQTSEVLKLIYKIYPNDFRVALTSLPQELAEKIKIMVF